MDESDKTTPALSTAKERSEAIAQRLNQALIRGIRKNEERQNANSDRESLAKMAEGLNQALIRGIQKSNEKRSAKLREADFENE